MPWEVDARGCAAQMLASVPDKTHSSMGRELLGDKPTMCARKQSKRPCCIDPATQVQPPTGKPSCSHSGTTVWRKTGTHLIGPFISLAFRSLKRGRGLPRTVKKSTSGSGGSGNIKKEKTWRAGQVIRSSKKQKESGFPGCHESF